MKNIRAIIKFFFKIALYIITLVILAVLALFIWEPHIIQVSSCLDLGGRWDYELNECEEASGYPVTPYDCLQAKGDWIQGEGCRVPQEWQNTEIHSEIIERDSTTNMNLSRCLNLKGDWFYDEGCKLPSSK